MNLILDLIFLASTLLISANLVFKFFIKCTAKFGKSDFKLHVHI